MQNQKKQKKNKVDYDALLKKYRGAKDIGNKVKLLSRLNNRDKKIFTNLLTKQEVVEYKEHASKLIERRYACVMNNRECLQALTADYPNLELIKKKYIHLDISICVYTIKAIINTYEGIDFSRSDGLYSQNSRKYYRTCKWYWERIIARWDTDTGVLSKEQIEKKQFSEYHKNANKVKTIVKQLESRIDVFHRTCYPELHKWEIWHHIDKGHKSRVGGPQDFQMFLTRCANRYFENKNEDNESTTDNFVSYKTLDDYTFEFVDKDNYDYLVDRDEQIRKYRASK